jgi:hypothetical protein
MVYQDPRIVQRTLAEKGSCSEKARKEREKEVKTRELLGELSKYYWVVKDDVTRSMLREREVWERKELLTEGELELDGPVTLRISHLPGSLSVLEDLEKHHPPPGFFDGSATRASASAEVVL